MLAAALEAEVETYVSALAGQREGWTGNPDSQTRAYREELTPDEILPQLRVVWSALDQTAQNSDPAPLQAPPTVQTLLAILGFVDQRCPAS